VHKLFIQLKYQEMSAYELAQVCRLKCAGWQILNTTDHIG